RKLNEFTAQDIAQRPDLFVRNKIRIRDAIPELGLIDVGFPRSPKLMLPEPAHRSFHPAEKMDAVGNMPDRHLLLFDLFALLRIERLPHGGAPLPVQFTDAIGRS